MSRKYQLLFLAVCGLLAGALWWLGRDDVDTPASVGAIALESKAVEASPSLPNTWKGQTETSWMLNEIGRDIAEMTLYAKARLAPDSPAAKYQPQTASLEDTYALVRPETAKANDPASLEIKEYVWSPALYLSWAQQCLAHLDLKTDSQKAVEDDSEVFLQSLTEPTSARLITASKQVSDKLSKEPLQALWHEQAAVILGVLALREASVYFADTRREMCRMSAHLAIARALNPKPDLCGKVAESILLTLAGRQTEALESLQQLPASAGAWQKALYLRNTSDWRTLKDPDNVSLIEQWELGRALVITVGDTAMYRISHLIEESPSAQWRRLVMMSGYSIQQGHVFVNGSLQTELKEFVQALELLTGSEIGVPQVAASLNETPGRAWVTVQGASQLQVISRGLLAASYQRHVCESMVETNNFLRNRYAVHEEADAFEELIYDRLSGLRLFPLVSQRIARKGALYQAAMEKSTALCEQHPEVITSRNWVHLLERKNAPSTDQRVPQPRSWFKSQLLAGTTYDFNSRYHDFRELWQAPDAFWEELIAMAPYNFDVIRTYTHRKYNHNTTAPQMRAAYTRVIDYHLTAMREYAGKLKDDPLQYGAVMQKAGELDPDLFIPAAHYFAEKAMPEKALQFFEAAFEKTPDRVLMANNSRWLVDYYFDHDRKEDALKVATEAGETYSSRGLETLGHLLERMNRLEAAEKTYLANEERYNDSGLILGFYTRHKDTHPEFAKEYQTRVKNVFPGGLEKVTLSDFTSPPKNGIRIASDSQRTREARIKSGDIVVALEGYRVGNQQQYLLVRGLDNKLPIKLIIWNGQNYTEITASPKDRRFSCELDDYRGE